MRHPVLNRKFILCFSIIVLTALCNCNAKGSNASEKPGTPPQHTKEAVKVVSKLKKSARRKTPYFGHQDALMYGQNWQLNARDSLYEKSDVYDVCGKYPFVLGLDLGRIEKGQDRNIDKCSFRQMKEAAMMHYKRGGLITISWHMDNPVNGKSSWDRTSGNVVARILEDSEVREKYLSWLDKGAEFINQLVDARGREIPILFRPLHECNTNSFWWSGNNCSDEEYRELWKLTFDYLAVKKGMKQLLWVYSPHDIKKEEELEARYPGDEFVDVIGYERYQLGALTNQIGTDRFVKGVQKGLDITIAFAKQRKKIAAFTETGFTGVPYSKWWTEALGEAIMDKRLSYVIVWRNGVSEDYYFGPCLKSESAPNFVELVRGGKIKLLDKK